MKGSSAPNASITPRPEELWDTAASVYSTVITVRQPVLSRPSYIRSQYVQWAEGYFRTELLRWLPKAI